LVAEDDLVQLAVGLETAVWQALAEGDRAADTALLADTFLGVYPTGFSDRSGHAEQLAEGPTVFEFSIVDPTVMALADDCLLLSYDARYRRSPQAVAERMYVSSVWQRIDGEWLNVFSQDTPALDCAPESPALD
jgi:hypothetical protein